MEVLNILKPLPPILTFTQINAIEEKTQKIKKKKKKKENEHGSDTYCSDELPHVSLYIHGQHLNNINNFSVLSACDYYPSILLILFGYTVQE